MSDQQQQQYRSIRDKFDKVLGELTGVPDVTKSAPQTIRAALPILGDGQTFIIQTMKRRDVGEYIFLEYIDAEGSHRIVIPPPAAACIYRQRDALGAKIRRQTGRRVGLEQAALRKARGEAPAFMKSKKRKRKARAAKPAADDAAAA